MDLNIVWFILIAILYTGYFVLEGFDFGVGILLPFLGKDDTQRRIIINTIGPHWDGNEVWLITAGGATFAAFPHWYATLFSGFYLPLFLILIALIMRGIAFEFRSKIPGKNWRSFWDWTICISSALPALLWGVAFANIIRGVPLDAFKHYIGGFWNLLNPYALLAGLASLTLFILHGASFLSLKTSGSISDSARQLTLKLWLLVVVLAAGLFTYTFFDTDIMKSMAAIILGAAALVFIIAAGWSIRVHKDGLSFLFTTLTILLTSAAMFSGLFPRVMVADFADFSLTIQNSASSPYTLQVMTIIAAIFVPIVLVYQAWSYWIFRKRIIEKPKSLEY